MTRRNSDYCDRVSRRIALQAGLAGTIGLGLPELLRMRVQAEEQGLATKDTAVIYFELAGGPTQHETYDPKPDAPAEFRGPLQSVATNVAGVHFSQYMAQQARIMDKLAVIRSIYHDSGSHRTSAHLTQTGYYLRDRQSNENDMPCIGSYAAKIRGPNHAGMPGFVSVPRTMRFGRAAWLGKGFNPFETISDAHRKDFKVANLTLLNGMDNQRMQNRQRLLAGFDASRRILDTRGVADATDRFTRDAFDMVTGERARRAFDISQEDEATRNLYGMNAIGQNTLLARRLVEHGVTLVSVRANSLGSWDDHRTIADRMKAKGPAYDQAVAALINDLYDRGLNRRVMVVCMGEFGRTPKINQNAGRDHWGRVMSVVLAGGDLRTGQVIGASDSQGAVPAAEPYRPENVLAVLYQHLGIDSAATYPDNSGRPRYVLEHREGIHQLV